MSAAPEDDDILCALLCRWAAYECDAESIGPVPDHAWSGSFVAMIEALPGGMRNPYRDRVLAAIAREEARLELERAKAALLDAATEVACVWGDHVGGEEATGERADVLNALYAANDAYQEALLRFHGDGSEVADV